MRDFQAYKDIPLDKIRTVKTFNLAEKGKFNSWNFKTEAKRSNCKGDEACIRLVREVFQEWDVPVSSDLQYKM